MPPPGMYPPPKLRLHEVTLRTEEEARADEAKAELEPDKPDLSLELAQEERRKHG